MSYEADAHAAQMSILRHLLLSLSAHFGTLQKATELTSDHFNFHLKKLIDAGYILKNGDGQYELTRAGKEYANRMDTDENVIEKQPKLSVVLVVKNDKNEFIVQQRLKQPYYGFHGRPTGKIRWGEKLLEAAARELLEETGLTAELEFKGVYHKMDFDRDSGDMLEDKYFYIIYGKNPKGTLITEGEGHRNEWLSDEKFAQKAKKFASVPELTKLAKSDGISFIEKRYDYTRDEY